MRQALVAGDLDGSGALLAEHWALQKRMDPGGTNPFIGGFFGPKGQHIPDGRLADPRGAMVAARTADDAVQLLATLARAFQRTGAAI